MKHILLFLFAIGLNFCFSQNNLTGKNDNNADLYEQILKSKKKFELIVYSNGIGKYDYQSELEAEFCGKQKGQDGTALYFKLIEETNKSHAIPINYRKFNHTNNFQQLMDGFGKKFKIKGRIKTSPYGNLYLRVDKIKPDNMITI